MTDADPHRRSRPATWASPYDTSHEHGHSNTSPAELGLADLDLCCNHWMRGKGCKYFFKGQCRHQHVDSLGGTDFLERNICHRYGRGKCNEQLFCQYLHAKDLPQARKMFPAIIKQLGMPQKPTELMTPLARAVLAAAETESEHNRSHFIECVLDVFERHSALQHPKIRECLNIVCKEIRDGTH